MLSYFQKYLNETITFSFTGEKEKPLKKVLEGIHLRIGTVQNYPLSGAKFGNETLIGKGVAFDLINYLQAKLGFTYSVVLPDDNSDHPTFEMLNNNRVDLMAAFLSKNYFEQRGFPVSHLLNLGKWMIIMKRPAESATGSGLTAPFDWTVWIIIFLSLVLIGPIIHSLIRFRNKVLQTKEEVLEFNVGKCSWFAYGALLKQGSTLSPKSDLSRILVASWWLVAILLTSFYTANLTAFLTLSQFKLPINSPEDIGKKHYNWVTEKGDPFFQVVEQRKHFSSDYLKGSKGISVNLERREIIEEFVVKKNFIFITEEIISKTIMYISYLDKAKKNVIEEERCTFVMPDWEMLRMDQVFVYSKKFKYSKIFTKALLSLTEGGIIVHKLDRNYPRVKICPLNLENTERKLRNTDLLLTYYLIACGYTSAIVIFLTELVTNLRNSKKKSYVKESEKTTVAQTSDFLPAPSYQTFLGAPTGYSNAKLTLFNGRDYWLVKNNEGKCKLIPARSPSAIIYYYKY